jgi:hypothetical protein
LFFKPERRKRLPNEAKEEVKNAILQRNRKINHTNQSIWGKKFVGNRFGMMKKFGDNRMKKFVGNRFGMMKAILLSLIIV